MEPVLNQPSESCLAWAANRLSHLGRAIDGTLLSGDGGARRYFRLSGEGLIVLHGPDKAENLAWLRIGRHLWYQGLPVPRIFDYNLEQGFFILEDLGSTHLADPGQTNLYPDAARLLARFHIQGLKGLNPAWGHQTKRYNAQMAVDQEINYFLKSLVTDYLQMTGLPSGLKSEANRLGRLAAPRPSEMVLIHRDYQGRNLMVRNSALHIIDWQGARPGPAAYDLASLIEETPHAPLSEEERSATVAAYIEARPNGSWQKSFERELLVVGAVRMMQALGAYGKLTLAGKIKFAAYIRPVLTRLYDRLAQPPLAEFYLLRQVTGEALNLLGTSQKQPFLGLG